MAPVRPPTSPVSTPEEKEEMEEPVLWGIARPHRARQVVLTHHYVGRENTETCLPHHWYRNTEFHLVELLAPEIALVRHTDTLRSYQMARLPIDRLPCEECLTRSIFRLQVDEEHFAYFVFLPQALDGWNTRSQAVEASAVQPGAAPPPLMTPPDDEERDIEELTGEASS